MATTDIRFKRIDKEYLSLRESQGEVFDKVDGFEGAVLGLNQAVAENRALIMENSHQIMENQKRISENRELIIENREMLLAIIKHLEIPYDRPPMGFSQE